jgi:type II secretory pathway pseudopilin PulG
MLIVVALVAMIAGVSYPSISSGLASLRMRSATNAVAAFLSSSLDRAERSQQAVELTINPRLNLLSAISADTKFRQVLEVPESVHIVGIQPPLANQNPNDLQSRRYLLYPGGSAPRVGVELAGPGGLRRIVAVDPLTGFPRVGVPIP